MKIEVNILNNQEIAIETRSLVQLVEMIWDKEASKPGEANIILVNEQELFRLNEKFLQHTDNTDVISFPISEIDDELFEGEIYISVDRVIENAVAFGVEKNDELRRMVAHGMLHFLGYTDKDPDNRQKMSAREDYYLSLDLNNQ